MSDDANGWRPIESGRQFNTAAPDTIPDDIRDLLKQVAVSVGLTEQASPSEILRAALKAARENNGYLPQS